MVEKNGESTPRTMGRRSRSIAQKHPIWGVDLESKAPSVQCRPVLLSNGHGWTNVLPACLESPQARGQGFTMHKYARTDCCRLSQSERRLLALQA